MARIFDGEVSVSYSQAYVLADERFVEDMVACFAGQSNGLCGAASRGILFLVTGLHTGDVPMAVERTDTAPPLDDGWEEVVEVSFHTDRRAVMLQGWAGGSSAEIDLGEPGDYRVRYCARGMDAAHAQDTRLDDEPVIDVYLLQFWPAPPQADVVVTQTSETAAYWHDSARSLPPPATPQDQEAVRQRAREENLRRQRETAIADSWSGRAPSARLREVAVVVGSLGQTDRELLDELAALDPGAQRDAARWTARRAFEVAGIDTLAWVRAGLDALDDDHPLPPPFVGDLAEAFALVRPSGPVTSGLTRGAPPTDTPVHRPSTAIPALPAATAGDPLVALLGALDHAGAAFDERRPELIAELRARYL